MGVTVFHGDTYGGQAEFPGNLSFGTVANINAAFQEVLLFAANLTLTNPAIDKTQPVFVSGYAWNNNYPPPNGVWFTFVTPSDPVPSFSFIEESNGVWTIPDLSGISMILPEQIVTAIPGLTWCKIEVYSNGLITPFLVVDSSGNATSSDASIDVTNQSVTMNTEFLASENGIIGPYSVVMSFITADGFVIVDGNGNQIAEPPLRIENFSVQNGIASLKVVGGDAGMVFSIQKSTDLEAWFQVAGPYTVGTNPWSIMFQDTASNRLDFYRTATTNAIPR
jgi:hypothetical protein